MKITKKDIAHLAHEIEKFLDKHYLSDGVLIFYNNKMARRKKGRWQVEFAVDPHRYCEYHAYNHILSMNFDGRCYEMFNCYSKHDAKLYDEFMELIQPFGVYFEMGYAWSLTFFVNDEADEVEYTIYKHPKEKIELHNIYNCPDIRFAEIINFWYKESEKYGDVGSCVIGAGFSFEFDGNEYWMSKQSPWQGSCSWESCKDAVKEKLISMGCTNVVYHWGNMD